MYTYRIENIEFKDGTNFNPGSLTVIVGPNNCGKSRILKDIQEITTKERYKTIVVNSVKFSLPNNLNELLDSYNIDTYKDEQGNVYLRTLSSSLIDEYNLHVGVDWKNHCSSWIENPQPYTERYFSSWFGNFFVSLLSTEDRLKIVKQSPSGDVDKQIHNLLQAFYKEGRQAENSLRKIIKETFNIDIRLDYSALINLVFRIGENLDNIPYDPMEARPLFNRLEKLDDQGDGLKGFIATYLSLMVGNRPVLLLDEPEAFLHPPQAMKLGEVIASNSNNERQIILATHSSDLLRGILNIRSDINLLRVERYKDRNIIHLLNPSNVATISNDPLLSSSRIIEGLFYSGVVVVESDSDSVFYQRVSRQVRNSDDIHYTHAHNKQTVAKVLSPYTSLGVKFAAIVDFDVIRVKDEFRNLLSNMFFTQEEINSLLNLREKIVNEIENIDRKEQLKRLLIKIDELCKYAKDCRENPETVFLHVTRELKKIREDTSTWKRFKWNGYSELSAERQNDFLEIDKICSTKGLFIVPVGELESWLINYGVERTSNKSRWIVTALESMHDLQVDMKKNPWKFIDRIHNYLLNG